MTVAKIGAKTMYHIPPIAHPTKETMTATQNDVQNLQFSIFEKNSFGA